MTVTYFTNKIITVNFLLQFLLTDVSKNIVNISPAVDGIIPCYKSKCAVYIYAKVFSEKYLHFTIYFYKQEKWTACCSEHRLCCVKSMIKILSVDLPLFLGFTDQGIGIFLSKLIENRCKYNRATFNLFSLISRIK